MSGDDSRPFEEVWNRVIEEPGERRGLYLIDKTSFVLERKILFSYLSYVFISFFLSYLFLLVHTFQYFRKCFNTSSYFSLVWENVGQGMNSHLLFRRIS